MKRIFITGGALLAIVPASLGLIGNASFAQSIPVRVPSQASVLDDHGGLIKHVDPGDDNGGLNTQTEPGDDNGGLTTQTQPGDDQGGLTRHAQPGDDQGGLTRHAQPADDNSGPSAPSSSAGASTGTTSTSGGDKMSDSSAPKVDTSGHGSGGQDDGSGHS